jgi:hypothetical protein
MAHAQKPDFVFRRNGRIHLNRLGASVQSTTGRRDVRISGCNAGYTMFRGSVKSTGYPLHSPVSPPLLLPCTPCTITFQLDSTVKREELVLIPLQSKFATLTSDSQPDTLPKKERLDRKIKPHQLLKTNKCTNMYLFILKLALIHLKSSYMFPSITRNDVHRHDMLPHH